MSARVPTVERPSGKTLVAVLAAVGTSVGCAAAVVWHVAVAGSSDVASGIGTEYIRPNWFPASLYLAGAGLAIGLIAASFLVDSGLRIVQDRQRSRLHLFTLLIVIGAALGAGSALAWTHWPPQRAELASEPLSGQVLSFWQRGTDITPPASDFGWTAYTAYLEGDQDRATFRPTIDHPWLVFPIGGVLIAALAALTLSLRDFRLTVLSDQDSV